MHYSKLGTKVVLVLFLVLAISTGAYAAEAEKGTDGNLGIGLGIPYGGIGLNYEAPLSSQFALSAGVGTLGSPGMGWAVGGRLYLTKPEQSTRWRLGAFYGTVAVIETTEINLFSSRKTYGTLNGFAPTVGFKAKHFDLDLVFPIFKASENTEKVGGGVKISLGYRF